MRSEEEVKEMLKEIEKWKKSEYIKECKIVRGIELALKWVLGEVIDFRQTVDVDCWITYKKERGELIMVRLY